MAASSPVSSALASQRWRRGALLAAILLIGARLAWVESRVMEILPDDVVLMNGSARIAAGSWGQIWAPKDIHFIPLYRLLRLPFDLHFPAWYVRFHAVLLAAHLASAAILYLLARRSLRSPWAALVTAMLFAWSTVGDEALVWKAAAPFALSWTFLLLALYGLTQRGKGWTAGAAAALLAAVGFFSGALFVIPGVLLGAWLLGPPDRDARRRALGVCFGVWLAGSLTWLVLVAAEPVLAHYWTVGAPGVAVLPRLVWAAEDTVHSYAYQFAVGARLLPERFLFWLLLLPVMALLLLRRWVQWRWILTFFVMTAPMLFVIVLIRREHDVWKISRYCYQGYTFWIAVIGSLFDALLWRLEPQPRWRRALLGISPLLAAGYLAGHYLVVRHHRDYFSRQAIMSQQFWFGWDHFFRAASAHRAEIGRPLRLPFLEVLPGLNLHVIYRMCEPRGLPGLLAEHGVVGTPEERDQFWQELDRAHVHLPGFEQHRPPRRVTP